MDPNNRYDAGQLLRLLDIQEPVAKRFETAQTAMLRETLLDSYRETIGVHPAQRQALRQALQNVRENGNVPVCELIEFFRAQSSRSLSSSTGDSTRS